MDGGSSGVGADEIWRPWDEHTVLRPEEMEYVRQFHQHEPGANQCTSFIAKHIKAPLQTVWSLVRRFDEPQVFKPFVEKCVMQGNIEPGCVREVTIKSGLPGTWSTERLELLDDNEHILSVKFIDGDHPLKNYSSILTVHHEVIGGHPGALVIESFVVDIPEENTENEIFYLVGNFIKINHNLLADVSERRNRALN
ncbi:hypothetical protein CFC21_103440 [Triticum aestivum]|uniref:Uncharacterized protein n=3 Tax=Triticum TaxID=4564 RepID=A0A9R1C1C4_TRITD|nr:abscisic acid receptor PYL3-like [Triticum dicoccoides]XP_044435191.1 abscisic acid receptor PYL3-like [Triticum aestivum]KAF7102283.1 hypothetical protein CFC21_103440 [Triticum aestivum]VAI88813.1 unnamed protein product [Triticum turgidum subsp. durum]